MEGKLVLDGVTYNKFLEDLRSMIKEEIENGSFWDEWLTQEQAGKEMGLTRRQIQGLIEKGIIMANPVGKVSRKKLKEAYTEILASSSARRTRRKIAQHQ